MIFDNNINSMQRIYPTENEKKKKKPHVIILITQSASCRILVEDKEVELN